MQDGLTLADIAAVTDKNGYGDGFGCWFWIVILLFFYNGNWNNRGDLNGALTRSDLQQGFDNQSVLRKLDGINNGLCDGFYAMNTNNLQMQNQLQRDLCQGFATINAGIAENRFAAQQCCCETNRNIDAVRYENAQNTCAIIQNATANTQKILDTMCANTIQDLRDKVTAKDQELQTANFQLSQQAQNATLINALRPTPTPAYPVMSPYVSNLYACGAYGNNGCCSNFA